jgi:hypothetical protein
MNARDRLVKFYSHANPSKLTDVDEILESFHGHEDELFRQLRRKYKGTGVYPLTLSERSHPPDVDISLPESNFRQQIRGQDVSGSRSQICTIVLDEGFYGNDRSVPIEFAQFNPACKGIVVRGLGVEKTCLSVLGGQSPTIVVRSGFSVSLVDLKVFGSSIRSVPALLIEVGAVVDLSNIVISCHGTSFGIAMSSAKLSMTYCRVERTSACCVHAVESSNVTANRSNFSGVGYGVLLSSSSLSAHETEFADVCVGVIDSRSTATLSSCLFRSCIPPFGDGLVIFN